MCDICSIHGKIRNADRIVVRKSEGKRILGKLMCKWADNMKMDVKNIVFECGD
jgi:hypothetical protein